jgi:molybdate transport system substrate-binding protein
LFRIPAAIRMMRRLTLVRTLSGAAAAVMLLGAIMARTEAELPRPPPAPVPLVAAAADLKFALDEIIARFERDTGQRVRVTYGSSGNLARQISQSAPYELFLSADEALIVDLHKRGHTRGHGELYGIGRIVLFVPAGSSLRADPRLEQLARRLAEGRSGRIAIANPDHAPYGRAAEQALRSLGLWEAIGPRLVLGENVAQAAQFAASGNADGGIIAYSLALAPELGQRGSYALIPDTLHAPLRQRMVLLRAATPGAERFYDYLRSPQSRAILVAYGFALPGE